MKRATCNVCDKVMPVKLDGNLWKHVGLDEVTVCDGTPMDPDMDVAVVQKGESLEAEKAVEATEAKDLGNDDSAGVVNPDYDPDSCLLVTFRVKNPSHMIYTDLWQSRSKNSAAEEARSKGLTPDGPAQCVYIGPDEDDVKRTRVIFAVKYK